MINKTSCIRKVKPSSSYGNKINKNLKKKLVLNKVQIPREYHSIYKKINKYSY